MSAPNKKDLRTAGASGKMTERQLAEQKEAKKLKVYTISFVVVLALMVVFAIYAGTKNAIASSGVREKNTTAVTIGDHKVSNAELSYYFIDYINNFYSNYGSYASLYGIDTSSPLDEQVIDSTTGETWADNFLQYAISNAQSTYALCDAANAAGYSLSEDEQAAVESYGNTLDTYATVYGYSSTDDFLKAQYGKGASKESYIAYYEMNQLASSYEEAYEASLTCTDEQIRARDEESAAEFSSYSYNQYYLAVSKFLPEKEADESGTVTYTDEENAAAAEAAEAAAITLTDESIKTAEDFDAAIAALSINEGTETASTAYTDRAYSSVVSYIRDWVTDSARTAGDSTYIPVSTTVTNEDGTETSTVSAYYVVLFNGINTNETQLVNVRHILISFSGDTDDDGNYTEEAKAANLATAEALLEEWKSGAADEESFAALANENSSDTGSNTNGGLYENIYPGQMVTAFNDWCFDSSRQPGDTGIVETDYGYHIMYFSSFSDQTYRNYMISEELIEENMTTWYNALLESCLITSGDTSYINKSITLG